MDVPVDELRPGVHLPLSRDLRFGCHRLRVTSVDVVTRERPALVPGDAVDGRLLLYASRVTVDRREPGWSIRWRPGRPMRADFVEVPLPAEHGGAVRVTLNAPTVEVAGP